MAPHAWHVPSVNSVEHMVFGAVQVLLKASRSRAGTAPRRCRTFPTRRSRTAPPPTARSPSPRPRRWSPTCFVEAAAAARAAVVGAARVAGQAAPDAGVVLRAADLTAAVVRVGALLPRERAARLALAPAVANARDAGPGRHVVVPLAARSRRHACADPAGDGRPEQHAPAALHAPFAQHGLPVRPQGRQIGGDGPTSQAVVLSLHMMPEQQGSLTPPQWTHLSVLLAFWYTHMTDGPSEQVPEPAPATGQQGWLTFPHPHAPCVQVPKLPADVAGLARAHTLAGEAAAAGAAR